MALERIFVKHGIKGGLLDYDDVLCKTFDLFSGTVTECVDELAKETGVDENDLRKKFNEIEKRIFVTHRVHPNRWTEILKNLQKEVPEISSQMAREGVDRLLGIYQQVPELLPGAGETLESLRKAGLKLAVVTHRYGPWHELVISAHGIRGYFDTEVVVGPKNLKTEKHWKQAAKRLSLSPEQCLGVEDRVAGILAMAKIGVGSLWWVKSQWDFYAEGENLLPERTNRINWFSELVPGLLALE